MTSASPRRNDEPTTPIATLGELSRAIRAELGADLGALLDPSLEEAHALLSSLDPPPDVDPLPPDGATKARGDLAALLDTLEDQIDALRLSPAVAGKGRK